MNEFKVCAYFYFPCPEILMQVAQEVETCVECSAKLPLNVSEVFYFAQKAGVIRTRHQGTCTCFFTSFRLCPSPPQARLRIALKATAGTPPLRSRECMQQRLLSRSNDYDHSLTFHARAYTRYALCVVGPATVMCGFSAPPVLCAVLHVEY